MSRKLKGFAKSINILKNMKAHSGGAEKRGESDRWLE